MMDTSRLHSDRSTKLGRRTTLCVIFVIVATVTSACIVGIKHDGYGSLGWLPSVLSGVSSIIVAVMHRSDWNRKAGVHDVLAELSMPTRSPTEDRAAAPRAATLAAATGDCQSLLSACRVLSRNLFSR